MTEHFHIYGTEGQVYKKQYEIGLVITIYNRPFYLHRTLASLRKSKLPDTIVMLVDDKSNNYHTHLLLQELDFMGIPVIRAFRKEKKGCLMYENLQFGWEFLLTRYQCKYLANLDSDTIVKPNWLLTLKKVHQEQKENNSNLLVTGFNAIQHAIIKEEKDFYYKESVGGINFFFDIPLFQNIIKSSLLDLDWDDRVVAAMKVNNFPIVCTKPSVVQHTGRAGVWSGVQSGTFDFATDYGDVNPFWMKLRLFWYDNSKKILQYCSTKFSSYKLIFTSRVYRLFFSGIYLKKKKS